MGKKEKNWVEKGVVFVLDLLKKKIPACMLNLLTFLEWIPHLKFMTGL